MTPALPNVVSAPPDVTLPAIPVGFVMPKMGSFRGHYPSHAQLLASASAVNDLGNFADYQTVLGTSAPLAPVVANAVTVALGWRALLTPAEAWDAYVRAEDAMAWQAAIALLDELKPLFVIAAEKNPALATMYPGLAQIFNAGKAVAKQALATKKKNAKVAAATAKAAATPTPANTSATPEVALPKSVTVNA